MPLIYFSPTVPRISGGRSRELARVADCPLHTLDGRRVAPDRQWMAIRGTDGTGAERLRHRALQRARLFALRCKSDVK